jgi:hypothetical protein
MPDPADTGAATGWFDPLYEAAERGLRTVPWDRGGPSPLLVEWLARRGRPQDGARALIVGSGLGGDAEHVAAAGYATTAFDVAPAAVRGARRRHPGSPVDYRVADLFDPPAGWEGAFDLVLESLTVQSLPRSLRARATAQVSAMVAPGGTLLVLSGAHDDGDPDDGPPWPLTRAEVEAFATAALRPVRIERLGPAGEPGSGRWRAELVRAPT